MKYCSNCGDEITFGPVPDDHLPRFFCLKCGQIFYQNPRIITGCISRWEDKILLCKRAIEPQYGKWTLPAGFMEMQETVEEGARRETMEEANADVEIVRLFSVYSIPRIGQVFLMFLADLKNLDFGPGSESIEVQLFRNNEIPWQEIAFRAIHFSLERFVQWDGFSTDVFRGEALQKK
jgi:ADP-ribose pyrophosphatase YjhB (NUDIX family)